VSGGSVFRRFGDAAGTMHHYRRLTSVGTPREELLALQRRRLVATARHAAATSPLYRELYAGIELADDLDVRTLPVVTKAMLMERFDEWVTDPRLRCPEVEAHLERVRGDDLYLGSYRCMPTGGSTGRKGIFVYDRDEWRQCLSAFVRWSELMGLRPRLGRRVRVATVAATSPLHMTARFGLSLDLGLYATRRLDARTPLGELVDALNEHRPEYVLGYPSIASLLAVEQLEGRLRIAPRVVCTTSEVRTEEMTANILVRHAPGDLLGASGDPAIEHGSQPIGQELSVEPGEGERRANTEAPALRSPEGLVGAHRAEPLYPRTMIRTHRRAHLITRSRPAVGPPPQALLPPTR